MLFNSTAFLVFFPVVYLLYWVLSSRQLVWQNLLILLSSYFFYGWWDSRFLILIILSTVLDYVLGRLIYSAEGKRKKHLLLISVFVNLGLLGFFKYFNFFVDTFVQAFSNLGINLDVWSLNIVLPVGISFYTFQTMSYTIDVYRGNLKPTNDFIGFASFVAFFPQLVAGPIERASRLLPQLLVPRKFDLDKSISGFKLIIWGFFKKVVIADSMAVLANDIFSNAENYDAFTLFIGALAFSFQIYGDFSGYSDIAIGTASLLGIKLMTNFNYPYLSRSVAEFWRRWHISLSTWFRDYLYIPLGGSRGTRWINIRNIFIVFLVSGLWHGANWTFVIWGGIHACLLLPLYLGGVNRKYTEELIGPDRYLPSIRELISIAITFTIVVIAWVFFRAESVAEAFSYLRGILHNTGQASLSFSSNEILEYSLMFMVFFVLSYTQKIFPRILSSGTLWYSVIYSVFLVVLIVVLGKFDSQSFIYFQF